MNSLSFRTQLTVCVLVLLLTSAAASAGWTMLRPAGLVVCGGWFALRPACPETAALPPDALRRLVRVLGGVAAAAGVLSALGQPIS